MILNKLDSIEFRLKELHDFSFLKKYGEAFWAVDETGSGCICIGMKKNDKKYFCKIAGVNTIEAELTPSESIEILKNAVQIYKDLQHPNLIRIIEEYTYKQFYVVIFEWADGDCLHDHWNFEKYKNNPSLKSPKEKFKELSLEKKLRVVDVIFSFFQHVAVNKYVAVDFYDGSIMYDFSKDQVTICDIDFFKKSPVINTMGVNWWGTKRLKAPEEYSEGSIIDEKTNVFTLGALIFDFFGSFSDEEVKQRYCTNQFVPCTYSKWQLNEESYKVAAKAVSLDRNGRYASFTEFYKEWVNAILIEENTQIKTLNRAHAEALLKEAAKLNNGNWIRHSYNVAQLAERIAVKSDMDSEKAYVFGLLHDIGRKNGATQARHVWDGYNYLMELGYEAEARICLTHTFQYKHIDGIYDEWDCSKEELLFISNYLESIVYDDYDKLIQLCDALSTAEGFCYAEKKMVSSVLKFGFKDTTINKWNAILELKDYFDNKCGMDIYLLFEN